MEGATFPVLDKGFVKVIKLWGDDQFILEVARNGAGNTRRSSDDENLLRYLMRHEHMSPFEFCEIVLQIQVPMDAWRQWIRHRTANVNEYSTRYSEALEIMQQTDSNEWRLQSKDNKQGSAGYVTEEIGVLLSFAEDALQTQATETYKKRLEAGVAKEQARKDLPLSTYTLAYWKCDLRNLLHFLGLRMRPDAQKEIRGYADVIGYEIVSKWVPLTWRAFLDYDLNALKLSARDVKVIQAIQDDFYTETLISIGWAVSPSITGGIKFQPNREREEFENKMKKMGISVPWL